MYIVRQTEILHNEILHNEILHNETFRDVILAQSLRSMEKNY